MVVSNLETNNHPSQIRDCFFCERSYVVQTGGQKAGSSPAVRVMNNNGKIQVLGFCSLQCSLEFVGGKIEGSDTDEIYKSWFGVGYQELFPYSYVAPARRVNGGDI